MKFGVFWQTQNGRDKSAPSHQKGIIFSALENVPDGFW
jgi:hypothetical protein